MQTEVSTIVWDHAPASATTRAGAILPEESAGGVGGGVPFTAVYTPGTGWSIDILAC